MLWIIQMLHTCISNINLDWLQKFSQCYLGNFVHLYSEILTLLYLSLWLSLIWYDDFIKKFCCFNKFILIVHTANGTTEPLSIRLLNPTNCIHFALLYIYISGTWTSASQQSQIYLNLITRLRSLTMSQQAPQGANYGKKSQMVDKFYSDACASHFHTLPREWLPFTFVNPYILSL